MTSDIRTSLKHADRNAFYKLAAMVSNFAQRVDFETHDTEAQRSACWIWRGRTKVSFHREGKRTNAYIRALAYDTAFDAIGYPKRDLSNTCGNAKCFNPDHMTDKLVGWWEDFVWLVQCGVTPERIEERLNTSFEDIKIRTRDTRNLDYKRAGKQYLRASLEARLGTEESEGAVRAIRAALTNLENRMVAA